MKNKSLMIILLAVVVLFSSKVTKSQTFVVDRMPASDFKIVQSKIYPNPSAGATNIAIEELPEGEVLIQVVDLDGNIVFSKNIYHENDGMFYTNIDANNISDEVYKVRIITSTMVLVKKWTKI